mgnify:CR=1 FL=1
MLPPESDTPSVPAPEPSLAPRPVDPDLPGRTDPAKAEQLALRLELQQGYLAMKSGLAQEQGAEEARGLLEQDIEFWLRIFIAKRYCFYRVWCSSVRG